MRVITFKIPEDQSGKKVYDLLKFQWGISSTAIKALKKTERGITLDGVPVRVVDTVTAGQRLSLSPPREERQMAASPIRVPVPYEDEDVIVFDKPAGMPVHQAHKHQTETLANVWAGMMEERLGYIPVFHPINRLDRDTSGLVLCAKHILSASIDPRKVEKRYTAVVTGRLEKRQGCIDAPIGMSPGSKVLREVRPHGQQARTHYQALRDGEEYSVIECTLETGRTHQIRVHMAYLGHPLAGDELYGGNREAIGRQALHCGWMRFFQPLYRRWVELSVPLPEDMEQIIQRLSWGIDE